jgi:uncharacterized membrane protein (DUF485 family)
MDYEGERSTNTILRRMEMWIVWVLLIAFFPLWLAVIFGEFSQRYMLFLAAGVITTPFWVLFW